MRSLMISQFVFKMLRASIVFIFLFFYAECADLGGPREGRLFGYRYTKTEILPKMVTNLIPSSCVKVEPSLPPCRNVRNMDHFPKFLGGRMETGELGDVSLDKGGNEAMTEVHTTPLGWGEYLGIYAPTVTVTAIHLETTTVMDSRTIVTFSVKGCRPSRLPMDLELCLPDKTVKPTPVTTQISPTIVNEVVTNGVENLQPAEEVIIAANVAETEKLKNL